MDNGSVNFFDLFCRIVCVDIVMTFPPSFSHGFNFHYLLFIRQVYHVFLSACLSDG